MRIRRAFDRFLQRLGYLKIPAGMGGVSAGGMLSFTNLGNARKQLEAYQSHVYKCVTLIYRRAVSVPMKLYKERGDEDDEVVRHPFIDLMRRPNPFMTGRFLKATTMMHLDLTGKAFWYKVLNGLGRPVEIWPLPVASFSSFVFNDSKTELLKYEFRTDEGRPVFYDPEEVVYFRYPHPIYFMEGASPIQAMAFAYDIDLALRTYQRNFFQNSARPDLVFESEQEIQPEDAKRLLLGWKQAHQGVDRSWEPAILDKGLKVNTLSLSAKDFEFANLAGWTKEDILEAYNIPEGKLGTVKDVNRANALGIDITFNSECISPRLDLYEETVSMGVLPHYDTGLYVKHVSCIPRDLEFDLKERESNLRNKYTNINEERDKEGLDPVPWGDAPFILISEIQYGEDAGIVMEAKGKIPPDPPLGKGGEKDRRERRRLGHERRVAARSRAYRAFLRKFFRRQEKEVMANLEQYFPRVDGAVAGMSIKKTGQWLKDHKDVVDQISFEMGVANKDLVAGSGAYLEGAIVAGGEEALTTVGADLLFDILNPRVAEFMRAKVIILKDVNRVTHDMLRKELVEGFEAGENMQTIAGRIRKVFGNTDRTRSLRIAQTEVNSSANYGSIEGYKQSGVVDGKEWLAGPDARPSHQEAAARYSGDGAIPLHQDFEVGMGRGPSPGNIGLPEEDINCRCTVLPVVRRD